MASAGAGGTGATAASLKAWEKAAPAPQNTTNFLVRGYSVARPGPLVIEARTEDGSRASAHLRVDAWTGRAGTARAKNIILLLGDGMGAAHRTAARIVSRGVQNGKASGHLAMDTLDVTGLVMTSLFERAHHGFLARHVGVHDGPEGATTTRKASFLTIPRTPSTTRASNMSASCCAARVVRDSTSAS